MVKRTPCWNQGIVLVLSKYIFGFDWLRLTSTCKDLRQYASYNREFFEECHEFFFRELPSGVTEILITAAQPKRLKRIFGERRALKKNNYRYDIAPIPETVTTLRFSEIFNRDISQWHLGKNITVISFGRYFNSDIRSVTFPDNLKVLQFGQNFDQEVIGLNLPGSLEKLVFGSDFNHPVFDPEDGRCLKLPPGLRELSFGKIFNQKVISDDKSRCWKLPETLKILSLGPNFSQRVSGWLLPRNIQKVEATLKLFLENENWVPKGASVVAIMPGYWSQVQF